MVRKKHFKANETITKESIKVGDPYLVYEQGIYDERVFIGTVLDIKGANLKLECKWIAISEGYDFGFPQNFRIYKNDRRWVIEGKIYKGKLTETAKSGYKNYYKLMRMHELEQFDLKI